MTAALATTQQAPLASPAPSNAALTELWKHAKMLAESDLVPKAYQGKPSNCVIAIELAARLGSSPLMIMQSLDIIQGKPSWSSKFLIATVNASGRFTPLRFRYANPRTKNWSCFAYASDINQKTGEIGAPLEGPTVDMAMAEAEGWLGKPGSKWKTMPELMLAYRAAAFWTRLNCPEVSMGLHTSEEREDMIQITAQRGGMPEDIKTALLTEGVTVEIPSVKQTQEPPSEPKSAAPMREPGEEG